MKKKIVFRSGSLRMGGLERVLIEVLQTIDRNKYEIILFIEDDCKDKNIFEKDIPEDIKYYFLKSQEVILATEYHKDRKKNLYHKLMYNIMMAKENNLVFKRTSELLKEIGDVDLFIDFDWGATKYIDKLNLKKSVVWIHNSIPSLKRTKSKIKRFGDRLNKYDKVIAICDEMKEEIETIYPFLQGKVERIYNPFNFDRIEKLSVSEEGLTTSEKEMLKDDYCVAVSRLDTNQKDYDTLLKAFKILKDRGVDTKLYIVGDGPDRKEIEEMITTLDIADKVKLIGLTKNPYVWMKNSNIFVHSSKYEGLPTVLIEAMICDKVVISSDCPTGPKEILSNGEAGVLYKVGDFEALAENLQNILKDEKVKSNLLEKTRNRKMDFNKNVVIKEYEKMMDNGGI
ncbi:MAG: glycosyltransferase [Cetobacterium sp.]